MSITPFARSGLFFAFLSALLWGLSGTPAAAADGPGITVSATGEVEAMPDVAELTATVSGSAELAGDAVEIYRSNKRRVMQALEGLQLAGLTISGSGPAVKSGTTPIPMGGLQGGTNQPKPADKVAIEERLTLTLSGIDSVTAEELLKSLIRLVDVTKDAGLAIGPSGPQGLIAMQLAGVKPASLATFKLTDTEALRQKAYDAAMRQARVKADLLANLAGVRLGDVVSIEEPPLTPKTDDTSGAAGGMTAWLSMLGMAAGKQDDYTASEFQAIPVSVTLNVQFEIVKQK